MIYSKPYLTVPEQIELLASRGMQIPDHGKAEEYLRRIGYYRLSAYWYPFRIWEDAGPDEFRVTDNFKPGTCFKDITDLYAFDKTLRLIALDAIERIEIAVRTDVALAVGRHAPLAHRDPLLLDGNFVAVDTRKGFSKHEEWIGRLDNRARTSKDEFAVHFRTKYDGSQMPLWIAVELLEFGPLSHFVSGMKYRDLQYVTGSYDGLKPHLFKSWVRSLCGVRNICAHHSRLWNRPLIDQPRLPAVGEVPLLDHIAEDDEGNRRIYAALAIMQVLLRIVNPRTKWSERLRNHIGTFPESEHISLSGAGFAAGWDQLSLWQE